MPIPLSYNLRNLTERRTTTLLTALGVALSVAVLLAVLALVGGLKNGLRASGHPLHLLVTRRGSTAELTSIMPRETYAKVRTRPGIALGESGEPLCSLELVTGLSLDTERQSSLNLVLRGLTQAGIGLRDIQLVEGRMFSPGLREVIVGESVAKRYPQASLGKTLQFGRGSWVVAGVYRSRNMAANSEVWVDLNQAAAAYNREQALSSVLIRAQDEVTLLALENQLKRDPALNVTAQSERSYYEAQTVSALPVQAMGMFVAALLAIGSSVAAMNTMYTAVARRSAEIGTLRVLGFSRSSVLMCFLAESLLLSLAGGIAGCLLVLPLNGLTTSMGSFTTFSEFVFRFEVSPELLAGGLAFAGLMGGFGGLLPAWAAARLPVLGALRA